MIIAIYHPDAIPTISLHNSDRLLIPGESLFIDIVYMYGRILAC